MLSVPPIVLHARKTRLKVRMGVLGVVSAVVFGVVAVLPLAMGMPPWGAALVLVMWSALMTGLLCAGVSAVSAHGRWTGPVLRAFAEAELARRVDREIDQWGDIAFESNRTLAAIRGLSLRIDALAGERAWIRDCVHTARTAARTLAAERRALSRLAPRDAVFDGARTRIDEQLETIALRLLTLFEALVAQSGESGLDAVRDALSRVSAEAEVAHPGRPAVRIACLSG